MVVPEIPQQEEQDKKIDLKDGIDQSELNKIIELSKNSEEFSKNIKYQLENSKDRKNISQNILISLSKSNPEDIVANRENFKKLLDNVGKDGVQNTVDFKIWSNILDSDINVELRKSVVAEENIKILVENKDLQKKVEGLTKQDQELKDYLKGIIENYRERVEYRQSDIQDLPLYQLSAYGIKYDKDTGVLTHISDSYQLFTINKETGERKYNPEIIKKEGKPFLKLEENKNIPVSLMIFNQTNKTEKPELSNENIKTYIGRMQIQQDMNSLNYEKINDYIQTLNIPTAEQKKDALALITQAIILNPTDATKYNLLITQLNQLDTHEQSEKNNETGLDQLTTILNSPNTDEYIQKNGPILFEQNSLAYNALFDSNNLEEIGKNENQKKNLIDLLERYSSIGEKDENGNYKYDPYSIDFGDIKSYTQTTTEKDTRYKKGINVIRIPVNINFGPDSGKSKELEIFFGTTQQLHDARAEKTKSTITEKGYNELIEKTHKIEQIQGKDQFENKGVLPIVDIVNNLDEAGSYSAFRDMLNLSSTPKNYLANNMKSVLDAVQSQNKDKDGSEDKINGYCNVIANHVVKLAEGGDLTTLKVYLNFVKDNTAYLGTDSANKITTRDAIGKFGDKYKRDTSNPDHKELQELLRTVKAQIDPMIKKDILTQVQDNLDKFIDTFGPILFKMAEFFGGKNALMKMFAKCDDDGKNCKETAISKYIKEQYEKEYKLDPEKLKAYNDMHTIIDGKLKDIAIDNNGNTPLKGLQNNFKDSKYYEEISKYTDKLNPETINSVFLEYNKVKGKTPINIDEYIQKNSKGVPEKIKGLPSEEVFKDAIFTNQGLRNNIADTSKQIKTHTSDFKGEDQADKEIQKKGITSVSDAARYLTLSLMTSSKNLKNIIIENKADLSFSNKSPEETPEQKAEKTLNASLKKVSDEVNKTAGSIIPTQFDIKKIDTDNDPNKIYLDSIIKPIEDGFKSEKLDAAGTKTKFEITAANEELLKSIKAKPQVLKDLMSYTASKDATNKTKLETLASTVTSIKDITKQTDGNIFVQVSDTQKLVIKPGPVFEEVPKS